MLNLPQSTELKKQLPKNAIFSKFQLNNSQKEKVDNDISKMFIVNELVPDKINIERGKEVGAIYVINVILKRKDYSDQSIILISKIIPQKIVFVLEYESEVRIAAFHSKLVQTDWMKKENANLQIKGLNLEDLWENFIVQIGNINISDGNTLDEQIESDDKKAKIIKEIEKLEKQARAEKQPKKKFELVQMVIRLKKEMGD